MHKFLEKNRFRQAQPPNSKTELVKTPKTELVEVWHHI